MAFSLLLDCTDIDAMAGFWAEALGYERVEHDPGDYHLAPPGGGDGTRLYFQSVPEAKTSKNRLHLDWDVPDMEAEAARLVELGATRIERRERPFAGGLVGWISMQDPEGNEFCVEEVFS